MPRSRRFIWVFLLLLVMLVFVLLLVLAKFSVSESTKYLRPELRADIKAVAGHIAAQDWVIIDARTEREYSTGHLQGALSVPWTWFVAGDGLPAVSDLAGKLDGAGLKPTERVVVMGGDDTGQAALVFLALDSVGHKDLQLLLEPLRTLRSSGLTIVSGLPTRMPPGGYVGPTDRTKRFVDDDWLKEHKEDAVFLEIVQEEAQAMPADGHRCKVTLEGPIGQETGTRLMMDVFAARVRAAQLDLQTPIVVYARSLLSGAQAWFVLEMMGYENVRLLGMMRPEFIDPFVPAAEPPSRDSVPTGDGSP